MGFFTDIYIKKIFWDNSMMKPCMAYIVLAFVLCSINLHAQTRDSSSRKANREEKMRLAVMELESKGVSKVVASAMSALIRSEMVDSGRFTVVERGQMDAILNEQGFQMTGCTDQACAVQMGKLLSANKVLLGEINQLGEATLITVRIVDVERGVAELSTSEKAKSMNDLDKAAKILVEKLSVRLTGQRPMGAPSSAGYYLRGIVPGWGQMYAGKTYKGAAFMGGFVATGCAFAYTYFDYLNKKESYDNLGPKESQSVFDSRHDDYKRAYNVMLYAGALWGVVYLANWVDMLFFTDSPGVIVRGIPFNNGYFAFDMFNRGTQMGNDAEEMNLNLSYKVHF